MGDTAKSAEQTTGAGHAGASNTGASHEAGYAGDLSPREAWDMLAREKNAVLIDVRSRAEWTFVGVASLAVLGKAPLYVSWQNYTTSSDGRAQMVPNPHFAAAIASAVEKDAAAIFLCRSGGRSQSAAIAMTSKGFTRAYNLAGGFEGDRDAAGHRGQTGGWKAAGLAWTQE
jgi:rhodanese-related sulfurtransferase